MTGSFNVVVRENNRNIVTIPCTEESIAALVQKNLSSLFPKASVLVEALSVHIQILKASNDTPSSIISDLISETMIDTITANQPIISHEAA
ncbi:MAG: hypothetical protein SFT81_01330 [Candidatus Caenarcaniphilales bacterium]|nr:hypothetical protein [Candidatus Caenarcaniphilales bacterium]